MQTLEQEQRLLSQITNRDKAFYECGKGILIHDDTFAELSQSLRRIYK